MSQECVAAGSGLIQAATPVQPLPHTGSAGFTAPERRLLLGTSGIGRGVIERIECAGVHSLQQLRELGVDVVVDHICDGVGNLAWRNRKRALLRALAGVAATPPAFSG